VMVDGPASAAVVATVAQLGVERVQDVGIDRADLFAPVSGRMCLST
jgi:hypothetical protein